MNDTHSSLLPFARVLTGSAQVELEVEELRKNFSQVGMETVDKLQDTIALSEAEMLGSLVHYMELYRDFFVNSNRFMVTLIPEIEEYKNYIELVRRYLTIL